MMPTICSASKTLYLVQVGNIGIFARMTFSRSPSKPDIEAEKWMTPPLWQEMEEKLEEICKHYVNNQVKSSDGKICRTESLNLSYSFEPISVEAYKEVYQLKDKTQTKENNGLDLKDHVLSITASLKRENRYLLPSTTMTTSQTVAKNDENSKKKILPVMAKNFLSSPLRQLQPKAQQVETCFVETSQKKPSFVTSQQKEVDFKTSSDSKIAKMNATQEPSGVSKSSFIDISPKKSRHNKKNGKSNMLSLKNKDNGGCSKNQPSIANYLVKTPPSEKPKVETETTKEKDSSTHVPAKRKLDDKIFYLSSPSKLIKKSEKSGSKQGKAREKKEKSSHAGTKNSRHTKEEMVTVKEEQTVDTPKTPDCKIDKFTFDSSILIEASDDEERNESVMDNLKKMVNELRSPVKSSTPLPKHSPLEDEALLKFPNPIDDPQYQSDCKVLQAGFESGDIDELDSDIVKRMFDVNLPYLQAIKSGEVVNLRHNEYHELYENRNSMEYVNGCTIFSSKSLSLFARLMGESFAVTSCQNIREMNYYLKVLLPELIAKIVMGVYKLNKKKAALLKMKMLSINMCTNSKNFNYLL